MICPECSVQLTQEIFDDLELDVCKMCEGIWFDKGELKKYRETVTLGGLRVVDEQAKFTAAAGAAPKCCPKCLTESLRLGTMGDSRSVWVCGDCRGVFAFDAKRLLAQGYVHTIAHLVVG